MCVFPTQYTYLSIPLHTKSWSKPFWRNGRYLLALFFNWRDLWPSCSPILTMSRLGDGGTGLQAPLIWSSSPGWPKVSSMVRKPSGQRTKVLFYRKFSQKKMINLDEEKIECALGNREFWLGKKAENGVFLFLTSELAVFICLWLQPNSTRSIMFCNISFSQNHSICTFLY